MAFNLPLSQGCYLLSGYCHSWPYPFICNHQNLQTYSIIIISWPEQDGRTYNSINRRRIWIKNEKRLGNEPNDENGDADDAEMSIIKIQIKIPSFIRNRWFWAWKIPERNGELKALVSWSKKGINKCKIKNEEKSMLEDLKCYARCSREQCGSVKLL